MECSSFDGGKGGEYSGVDFIEICQIFAMRDDFLGEQFDEKSSLPFCIIFIPCSLLNHRSNIILSYGAHGLNQRGYIADMTKAYTWFWP